MLQSALRLKPNFTDAYNNMASALVQKGMIPAALQCYQSALQINPGLVNLSKTFVYSPVRTQVWAGDYHCKAILQVMSHLWKA